MAITFDGTVDRLVYNDASFLVGLSEFTFSAWVKCNAPLPYDIGFFKTNDAWSEDDGIGIRYDASGILGGGTSLIKCGVSVGGVQVQTESQSNLQTNDWAFVCYTWASGSAPDIYIDGEFTVPTATNNATLTGTTSPASQIDQLYFGTGAKGSATTGWNGDMEDIRLYDRALSAAEIKTLFSVRGNDNITQNLLFRVLFNEQPKGTPASLGSVKDLSGLVGDADIIAGSPVYSESPGFSSRRLTRNT